jgi:C_GCAxxG_C_C family probable redox protein
MWIQISKEGRVKEQNRERIEEAGRRAVAGRKKGFHCSESVFTAINDVLKITDPSLVKMVTGFHGGGGVHRKEPGINLTEALEAVSCGKDRRAGEDLPFTNVGHLCGALAAGIACISFLYGRTAPTDDLTCVDELCYELHRRFSEAFGEKECRPLRNKWIPVWPERTCETVYRKAAEMATEILLEAPEIVPECPRKIDV